jgi:hypothetical protein
MARAEIEKAVRAYVRIAKADAKLEGVRFFEDENASVR